MSYLDQFKLTGKSVIVTGGSKGLGRAMALGLAEAGARVAVVSRSKNLIEETAQEIIRAGGEAMAVPADVRSERDIEKMVEIVADQYGEIDILVNNAGIAPMNRVVDITMGEWDDVMGTNMRAMFLTARSVGKRMIKQRRGKGYQPRICSRESGAQSLPSLWGLQGRRHADDEVSCIRVVSIQYQCQLHRARLFRH